MNALPFFWFFMFLDLKVLFLCFFGLGLLFNSLGWVFRMLQGLTSSNSVFSYNYLLIS